jgi:hypothetical protein
MGRVLDTDLETAWKRAPANANYEKTMISLHPSRFDSQPQPLATLLPCQAHKRAMKAAARAARA